MPEDQAMFYAGMCGVAVVFVICGLFVWTAYKEEKEAERRLKQDKKDEWASEWLYSASFWIVEFVICLPVTGFPPHFSVSQMIYAILHVITISMRQS